MVMMPVYKEIKACRICRSTHLEMVLDLGIQALTSRFPNKDEGTPPRAPLVLMQCHACGLVQLRHSVNRDELYTHSYGYASGINSTMRTHLSALVRWIEKLCPLKPGDIVVDIGCNDGTLLKSYAAAGLRRVGIDPIAVKFRSQYPADFQVHESFFSEDSYRRACGSEKAKVITSIAMFYDLESPTEFSRAVESALADDGIWVLEQSYLPTMLESNSFDTICHEHLEYYALRQIEELAERSGLRVFDVELNDTNGGSFRLALCRSKASFQTSHDRIKQIRHLEKTMALGTHEPYEAFRRRIEEARDRLVKFIDTERAAGRTFYLYGASTKGNTLLQYCGLDASKIVAAAERNPEKFGRRTPLTDIPILSERECRAAKPDYFLVLPWHFRAEIIEREAEFLNSGGKLVFPLPKFEVVQRQP